MRIIVITLAAFFARERTRLERGRGTVLVERIQSTADTTIMAYYPPRLAPRLLPSRLLVSLAPSAEDKLRAIVGTLVVLVCFCGEPLWLCRLMLRFLSALPERSKGSTALP